MKCTTQGCRKKGRRIMAWFMLDGKAIFVAPYCHEHAADIEVDMLHAVPACGPALSDEAREIEGIR